MSGRFWRRLGAAAYLLLCAAPIAGVLRVTGNPGLAIPDSRRLGLLLNTAALGSTVAVLCMALGFFAAVGITCSRLRHHPLRWWFLLLAPVPQYIYALSWMELIRLLGGIWPALLRLQIYGLGPCAAVETMAFLPLCTGLALLGLERQDAGIVAAGLVCKSGDVVLYRICLPQLLPWLLSGAGCVFVLSATDFSIPSLFQYNVYAMELFSDFSVYGKAANSLWLALPLVLLALAVVGLSQKGLRQILTPAPSSPHTALQLSGIHRCVCLAAVAVCVFQTVVPLVLLIAELGSLGELAEPVRLSWRELLVSCQIGSIAAAVALPPSCAAAAVLSRPSHGRVWQMIFLLPLAMPGALVGVGWLTLLSGTSLQVVAKSVLLPALGCAGRFMPFCVLVLTGTFRRLDIHRIQAAQLLQGHSGKAFVWVLLPMCLPGLLAGGLMVFLLSLGDVGVTLMLAPPGMEPFSIKVYNYLHYGASDMVSGFCLLMALTCAMTTALILWVLRERRNRHDKSGASM